VCLGVEIYQPDELELELKMLKEDKLLLKGLRHMISLSEHQQRIDAINTRKYHLAKHIAWIEIVCGFLLIGLTVTLLLVDAGVIPNVNPFL
jgi:hypothetical protein